MRKKGRGGGQRFGVHIAAHSRNATQHGHMTTAASVRGCGLHVWCVSRHTLCCRC
jgi:hypothetical protein